MQRTFCRILIILFFGTLAGCAKAQTEQTHAIDKPSEAQQSNATTNDPLGLALRAYDYIEDSKPHADCRETLSLYQKAAELGSIDAAVKLGTFYDSEYIPEELPLFKCIPNRDVVQAGKWFDLAAQKGGKGHYGNYYNTLGGFYDRCPHQDPIKGCIEDLKRSQYWFTKSAEADGDGNAMYRLGELYDWGRGVPKDYVIAYMWFNLASAQGERDAARRRDILTLDMTKQEISEAQRLTREWRKAHPNKGIAYKYSF